MQGHLQACDKVRQSLTMLYTVQKIYLLFTFFAFRPLLLTMTPNMCGETLHCRLDRQNKNKHVTQQVEMFNVSTFC